MASQNFPGPMSKKPTQEASKRPRGRPRKYTLAEAQKLIEKYFKDCDSSDPKEPYTITGLALALDTTRETLCRWTEDGHELSDTIKKAKTRVEWSVEKMLLKGGQAAGPIFWLKNFGWTDRQEVVQTTTTIDIDPGRDKLSDEQLDRLIAIADREAAAGDQTEPQLSP